MKDSGGNILAGEGKVVGETRCVVWRAFFVKKKVLVILYFLAAWVVTPVFLWDGGFNRHFTSGDFSFSVTVMIEFLVMIIVCWFGFLFGIINEFAKFHEFKNSILRPYDCIRSSFVSRRWKWICFVTVVLLSLAILYCIFMLATLL